MHRRLYFLAPGRVEALSMIEELSRQGIHPGCIQILADKRTRTDGLPQALDSQKNGAENRLEKAFWNGNLVSFALAFGFLIFLLITQNLNWWLLLPTSVLAVNFITGLKYSNLPGNTHCEFRDALAHGEILLLVDVPDASSADIERNVHRRYPEAAIGRTGWGTEAFG